tara:strand:- start:7577 stop:8287 length:711 start_codon:yes stop_codon:yes gene_type:complete
MDLRLLFNRNPYPFIHHHLLVSFFNLDFKTKGLRMTDYIKEADDKFYFDAYGSEEELTEENFYVPTEAEYEDWEEETEEWDISEAKPGLWENIRKKKEREGKKYKPAKKGDPDRPDPESWKKAQNSYKYKDPKTGQVYEYERRGVYKKDGRTLIQAAEYQGRKVQLGKPFRTPDGPKKRSVYVKNDKGNVVKVNFGDPNMKIKKSDPGRRKNFRARHNCDNPGPRWKARYWSCRAW